ncbi:MAG: efflux RND transporter permease subunit [Magnetococcus sp. DMHC-6]
MLRPLLQNHVFANLTFALILITGFLAYFLLPRQQDPDMNFNWIQIVTLYPGASAEDIEKLITDPLEEAIEKVADIRFVSSDSQNGTSTILVRFNEIDAHTFDKRINDLRREVANKEPELPAQIVSPFILEITSSNGFPSAIVVIQGQEDDENLRRQALHVQKDIEQLKGVDMVLPIALRDPEIQIRFFPERLANLKITPMQVADAIRARFRDVSAGAMTVDGKNWLLRLEGTTPDPDELARWTLPSLQGEIPLSRIAEVVRSREKPAYQVRYQGKPAVLLSITKQVGQNSLTLTDRIRQYIEQRQELHGVTGVAVVLADDQTSTVRNALSVMESNALLGLMLVLLVTWLFFGGRIAFLVSLGIPFALAGTFALLYSLGESLNVMVLLGVVIALGMLVDDAVVVVEAIFIRLQTGSKPLEACIAALQEVALPVASSSLTTIAAFLPLMLLPGILGKFMRVIPLVVTLSLIISLVEAFWMLPTHVTVIKMNINRFSTMTQRRRRILQRTRSFYIKLLCRFFRYPRFFITFTMVLVGLSVAALTGGWVRMDFFAMDPLPIYYVNIEMAPGDPLEHTMQTVLAVEKEVNKALRPGEARAVVSYAGQMFTDTKPFFGDRYGQILVSLSPDRSARRPIQEIIDGMRGAVLAVPGAEKISFFPLTGGPPVSKPISVKVRGETFEEILPASRALRAILADMPEIYDITDNYAQGRTELLLKPDGEAIRQAGLNPGDVSRLIQLLGDGEVVSSLQDRGEKVELRMLAHSRDIQEIDQLLNTPLALPNGDSIALEALTTHQVRQGIDAIRHYNYRRAITIEADLDKKRLDVVAANTQLQKAWEKIQPQYPGVSLDFSGIMDDITESMDAIFTLFLFGIGLIYMILGTQFRSYFQPFLILTTIPMAFMGVLCGLLITGHPLSLYTLYGVVALSGIAVNSSIVLISAANDRIQSGIPPLHAILYAARRRIIPILITSLTTIAGLSSLAFGLGGHSLLWGPVATAIVWGLFFSTLLTLFLIPLLYWLFSRRTYTPKTLNNHAD